MKKFGKKIFACAMSMALMLSMAGCGKDSSGESANSNVIKIGTSFPMTGTVAADGELIVNSIKLAAEQINAEGGINGKTIEIVSEDDESDPTAAASVANKFADNDSVVAVLTSYNSSCALAQIPIYKEVGLSALSPVATSPSITGLSNYFYRTCNNDNYVGGMCAQCCKDLGMTKVYVLYENDDYGYGIYDQFVKNAEDLGMEVVGVDTFVYGETKDFSTIITKINNSDADGIFFAGLVTEMGLLANQAGDLGIPIFADEGCYSPAMITEGGEAVEGLYSLGAFHVGEDREVVKDFVEAYRAKYNEDPSTWSALAYDAAMTLFESMKTCETINRKSVNEALQNIAFEGVTGTNKFTDSDVEKQYIKVQIQDGAWVVVE